MLEERGSGEGSGANKKSRAAGTEQTGQAGLSEEIAQSDLPPQKEDSGTPDHIY